MSSIYQLHFFAQKLSGLKEDHNAPPLTPAQLSPNARREHEDEYFRQLGKACHNFLCTRKKFTKRPEIQR